MPFKSYLETKKNITWSQLNTNSQFHTYLRLERIPSKNHIKTVSLLYSDFLFDVNNAKQQYNFKFNGSLACNKPTPSIMATQMQLQYGLSSSLPPPSEYLPAKKKVDDIILGANISSHSFALSPVNIKFINLSKLYQIEPDCDY